MKVTVFYDYNCPFCFLGIKRLELLESEFHLEAEWKGIEIHPEIPPQGRVSSNTLKRSILARSLEEIYLEDDPKIKLPGILANSRLSLEASEFAKTEDKFLEFHEGIYTAYFEKGDNISTLEVILRVGEQAGLEAEDLRRCLTRRTMRQKIEENRKEAQESHVFAVPAFVIGGLTVHGIQSLESLRKIIAKNIERS